MHASAVGNASRNADRLAKVRPQQFYVIDLYGSGPQPRSVVDTLGPYTKHQADKIAEGLTCQHHVRSLSVTIPEWATT